MLGVLFLSIACLLVFGRRYLDIVIYDNLQDLEEQDFEQLWERSK
jgi:hypothetical protein